MGTTPGSSRQTMWGVMDADALNLTVDVHPSRDLPGVWIASCPELDLATQGTSQEDARLNLNEALDAWFSCCLEYGTLDGALRECGLPPQRIASIKKSLQQVYPMQAVPACLV